MKIFIKTKIKKSDDQTNTYRVAANITEYHIIIYKDQSFLESLFQNS